MDAVQPNQVNPVPKDCTCAQSQGALSTTPCNDTIEAMTVSPLPGCNARLTASLRALGLVDSIGVDSALPNRLNGPILKLDLLNPSHLAHVESLICNKACVYVHFAPPCGTSSRARLIQNSERNLPPPLRNDQYPNGLPWLTADQQVRVNKANELYNITCRLIRLCDQHQILCYGPAKTLAGRLCGKPLPFKSCLPPCSVRQLKCITACLDRPEESSQN